MYNNEFELEFEQALGQEQQEGGFGQESAYEFNPEFMGEMALSGETFEMSGELNETQEMELAHELLSVQNEEELNQFLGKLIKGAGKAIGNFARSGVGRALGGVLKTVAKKALPFAAGALGTFVGGPLGGMIGSKLGAAASNLFELELEGLSPEDQEFEMARAYVRFANGAARQAAGIYRQQGGQAAPQQVLRQALTSAARQHAPGLLRPVGGGGLGGNGSYAGNGSYGNGSSPMPRMRARSGTWTRQGRTLVIQL
jgi:uncharacterized protein (DUF697 family)